MLAAERERVSHLAEELHRTLKACKHARQRVLELGKNVPDVALLGAVVGMTTAAVLFAEVGSPKDFSRRNHRRSGTLHARCPAEDVLRPVHWNHAWLSRVFMPTTLRPTCLGRRRGGGAAHER